jgi:hypothetical protein
MIDTYPKAAGWKDNTVSKDNAILIEESGMGKTLREKVLELYQSGFVGTSTEAAQALGISLLSVRPRCTELYNLGDLQRTGVRRQEGQFSAWEMRATPAKPQGELF